MENRLPRFAKYAWGLLAYNLLVILWGAYVRASGSGAGCGSHWPLCNGEVIPLVPRIATLIEFIHRMMSGLSVVLIVGLIVWAFRSYPKTHPVRLGASLSMLLILTESLVGAALVLFNWVGMDASVGRVISIALHLTNTFFLLAALTLTAWWSSGGLALSIKNHTLSAWGLGFGLLGILVLGITGSINALGDTLFPVRTFAEGFQQDLSGTAPLLIRLRFFHPAIAITVGFYVLFVVALISLLQSDRWIRRFAVGVGVAVLAQWLAGLINVTLAAPTWMQLVHLFLADSVWILTVLFFAAVMAQTIPIQTEVKATI
jgi:heme A synthase